MVTRLFCVFLFTTWLTDLRLGWQIFKWKVLITVCQRRQSFVSGGTRHHNERQRTLCGSSSSGSQLCVESLENGLPRNLISVHWDTFFSSCCVVLVYFSLVPRKKDAIRMYQWLNGNTTTMLKVGRVCPHKDGNSGYYVIDWKAWGCVSSFFYCRCCWLAVDVYWEGLGRRWWRQMKP